MTLTQLRYLIAVADSGLNISVAAEVVHATQPCLSKQIKQLEEQLGFQLFARKGRSLKAMSPAGVRVLAYARRVMEEAANIRRYAANERGDCSGRLTLSTSHMLARYVLPPILAAVTLEFPKVSLDIQAVADVDIQSRLAHDDADLALLSSTDFQPLGGMAVPLFSWKRVVVVPRAHPLARLDRAPTLAELAKHPLIAYEASAHSDSSLRRAFLDAGLQPMISVSTRDASLINTYVRAGMGAGIVAEMAISQSDSDLVTLPAPAAVPDCITWAVVPRGRVLRQYALALLHGVAPQLDRRDLRNVLEGNVEADWPTPHRWQAQALPQAA